MDMINFNVTREGNDRNQHRRKFLLMHYSCVTHVTEQSRINGLLDDGVAVRIVTFSTLPSFLWMEWGQCPSGRKASCVGQESQDKRNSDLQMFHEFGIGTYTVKRWTRVEVIESFYEW